MIIGDDLGPIENEVLARPTIPHHEDPIAVQEVTSIQDVARDIGKGPVEEEGMEFFHGIVSHL